MSKTYSNGRTKETSRAARLRWYYKNREQAIATTIAYNKRTNREVMKWLWAYKSEQGCSMCPENHPACLDFHHRNPDEKDPNLKTLSSSGWSMTRILEEIKKCDVLCSNCHRKHHYNSRFVRDVVEV